MNKINTKIKIINEKLYIIYIKKQGINNKQFLVLSGYNKVI